MAEKTRSGWQRGCGCFLWVFLVVLVLFVLALAGMWFWVRGQFFSYTAPLESAKAVCGDPQPRSGPFQGIQKLQEYASTIEEMEGYPERAIEVDLSADDVRDVVEASLRFLAEKGGAQLLARESAGGAVEGSEQTRQAAGMLSVFAFDKAGVQAALRGDGVDLCVVLPLASPISAAFAGGSERAISLKTNIFISVGDGSLELTFREAELNGKVVDPATLKAFDQGFGGALFEGKSGVGESIQRLVHSLLVADNRVRIISPTKDSRKPRE